LNPEVVDNHFINSIKMKIAFDAKRALNNATGLGSYSRNLLRGLMHYYPGNEYFLLSPKVKEHYYNELEGSFRLVLPETRWQQSFNGLWRSWVATKTLVEKGVEVYHGMSNELPFNLHTINIRKVVTIHDVLYKSHPHLYPFFDRQVYDRKVKYACDHADVIVAASQATKAEILKYYKVDEAKIKVVLQAVSPLFFSHAADPVLALPAKYILQVGSFTARKNHLLTLKAFAAIKDKVEEKLVFAGVPGETLPAIKEFIKAHALGKHVLVLSGVGNEALPALYKGATLSLYPSSAEGFGLPVAESMVCNTPVITTAGSCMAEVAGNAAWYAANDVQALSSVLLKALIQKEEYNAKKQECEVRKADFHPATFAAGMMGIYTS
jgi:glycosyltransferase involved in cell wall biosynthesis